MSTKKPAPATALIHHAYEPPAGFVAPQPPVHKASTVIFPNVAALRARNWKTKGGYTYGLHGTPTSYLLEERIATLEGGLQSQLVPSGLAAIALVDFALLASGDEVLIPENAYGPNRELARQELARLGITHRVYDPMDVASFQSALGAATKLVWLEAPGSVTMEFPDVRTLARLAHERGALVALDNTWGAGMAFNAFAVGADIAVHALTKYPSGGADVLMGAVTTRDEALHLKLKGSHMRMGWGVGANDCELVLRSLSSLPLRYAAQDEAGRALARWWQAQPCIARVLHPALAGSPGHEHWKALCSHAAGLFSIQFDERIAHEQAIAFVDALRLFKLGYSWAGPVSLAVPYDLSLLRAKPAGKGLLVRFSLGLEAVGDLIDDCDQALRASGLA